jgi:hypothetical protein
MGPRAGLDPVVKEKKLFSSPEIGDSSAAKSLARYQSNSYIYRYYNYQ